MQSNVCVTASGPALSLLLYETTKTSGYQMGFLLGSVVNQVTDTISDLQIRGKKTETIISVMSILPISSSSHVVNGAGKINRVRINEIIEAEKKLQNQQGRSLQLDIVGWYRFKRNMSCKMTMQEHIIHQQLAQMAEDFSQESSPDLFVLCLLFNNMMSRATHVFKHSFMRFLSDKRSFEYIPLQIHNLGMRQSIQYQITACAPSRAVVLQELFEKASKKHSLEKNIMLEVQSQLQVPLNKKILKLSNVEKARIKLEDEVLQLRKELDMETAKMQKVEPPREHTSMADAACANESSVNDQSRGHGTRGNSCKTTSMVSNEINQNTIGKPKHSEDNGVARPSSPIFNRSNRPNRSQRPESLESSRLRSGPNHHD